MNTVRVNIINNNKDIPISRINRILICNLNNSLNHMIKNYNISPSSSNNQIRKILILNIKEINMKNKMMDLKHRLIKIMMDYNSIRISSLFINNSKITLFSSSNMIKRFLNRMSSMFNKLNKHLSQKIETKKLNWGPKLFNKIQKAQMRLNAQFAMVNRIANLKCFLTEKAKTSFKML